MAAQCGGLGELARHAQEPCENHPDRGARAADRDRGHVREASRVCDRGDEGVPPCGRVHGGAVRVGGAGGCAALLEHDGVDGCAW